MSETDQRSPLARVSGACAMALGGALICALPTMLRARAAGGSLSDSLLTAVAVMLVVLTPFALLLPKAARGWRGVVGQTTPRRVVAGLLLWVVLCGAVFAFLGTFLKAKTHHRGLGGATFGVFAAVSALLLAVLVARGVSLADRLQERASLRWPIRIGGGLLVIGALAFIGLPLLRAEEGPGTLARASIFDVLLGAVVVSLLLTREAPKALAGAAKLIALPVTLSIVVIGFVRVETSNVASAIRTGGGAVATILGALEAWTDRDGDGVGSHFGGRDCDEGDPKRRPGADDQPGDGVDLDCDGVDGSDSAPAVVATAAPEPPPPSADSAATVVASAPKAPEKPDIIVVTLDTVRADHTTVYGYGRKTTPHLQELADRGVVFEHAYATGSTTQRALVPIISGTTLSATPHTNKEWPRLREESLTVAERMKAAGYTTGGVSSFTWVRNDRGFGQGFDELDQSSWKDRHPERESTGDLALKAAVRLHQKMATGSTPLYLWVHLFDAHSKYVEHPGIDFGKNLSDAYDGELAFVDQQLGKLMEAVAKSGRDGRTVWIVHGSHGEAFGEHGQTGHGTQLYEESIRVPLIFATPWSAPSRYATDAVSTLDVAPTVLDLAGASASNTTGVSLRPVLDGKAFEHGPVYAYANRRVAVIDWPLKLYVFRRKERRDRLLLFDLTADPKEEKDASSEKKDVLVKLDAMRQKADETSGDD